MAMGCMELLAAYMAGCIVREKKMGVSRCCWRRGGGDYLIATCVLDMYVLAGFSCWGVA